MIKHIVAWQFADEAEGADKATNVALVANALRGLPDLVPGILEFEVITAQPGLENTFDLALYAVFTDAEALQAFEHQPDRERDIHGDIDPGFPAGRQLFRRALRGLCLVHQGAGAPVEEFAGGRQYRLAPFHFERLHAELGLELLDGVGDRGLALLQSLGRLLITT